MPGCALTMPDPIKLAENKKISKILLAQMEKKRERRRKSLEIFYSQEKEIHFGAGFLLIMLFILL